MHDSPRVITHVCQCKQLTRPSLCVPCRDGMIIVLQVYMANIPMDASETQVRALVTKIGEVGLSSTVCSNGCLSQHSAATLVAGHSCPLPPQYTQLVLVFVHTLCDRRGGERVLQAFSHTWCLCFLLVQVFQLRLPRLPDGRNKG